MANGVPTGKEFLDFTEWMKGQYGLSSIRGLAILNYRDSPFYNFWKTNVETGRLARQEAAAGDPEVTTPFQFRPEQIARREGALPEEETTEFDALVARARQIAELTGRKFEDVLAELSGLSVAGEDDGGLTDFEREQLANQRIGLGQQQAKQLNERRRNELLQQFNIGQQGLLEQQVRAGQGGLDEATAARIAFDEFERIRGDIADTPRNFFQKNKYQLVDYC